MEESLESPAEIGPDVTPLLATTESSSEAEESVLPDSACCDGCVVRAKRYLQAIARPYHSVLEKKPLIVKSVTAFFLLGAADLAGQGIQAWKEELPGGLNLLRMLRFAIFGLVLQAPWNHFYYVALDEALPPTERPWTKRTFVKVIIDQFIQAPVFTVCTFLFLGAEGGKSISGIVAQLKQDYFHTMIANWKLWVPATIINLGLVSPLYRVLYLNIVFFFWSIILSLILNSSSDQT